MKHCSIMLMDCYRSFPRWNSRRIWYSPWFNFFHNYLHTLYSSGHYLHHLHNNLRWINFKISLNITSGRMKQLEGTVFLREFWLFTLVRSKEHHSGRHLLLEIITGSHELHYQVGFQPWNPDESLMGHYQLKNIQEGCIIPIHNVP